MLRACLLLACLLLAVGCGGAPPIAGLHVRSGFVVPPFAAPTPGPAPRPMRPSVSGEEVAPITSWSGSVQSRQIALLEDLIADTDPADPEMAELQFRLGELHDRLQGEALLHAADPAGSPERRARFLDAAEQALQEAAKAYGAAIAAASYPRRDLAMYRLGRAQAAGGLLAESDAAYLRLIDEHPTSTYLAAAYVALGDHRFTEGSFDAAAELYDRGLTVADGALAHYLAYRQAWVALARDAFADALAGLARVIDEAATGAPFLAEAARAEADALLAWLGFAARTGHVDALATGTPGDADRALVLYDAYLGAAPDGPDRAETRAVAAELAWHRAEIEADRTAAASLWTAAAARFDAAGLADVAALARDNAARVSGR